MEKVLETPTQSATWQQENPFEEILKKNKKYLHTLIQQMPKSHQYYDDYYQIAMLSLWESWKLYDPAKLKNQRFMAFSGIRVHWALLNWMKYNVQTIRIPSNQAKNWETANIQTISGNTKLSDDGEDELFDVLQSDYDLFEVITTQNQDEKLYEAIECLKPKYQDVINLTLGRHKDYEGQFFNQVEISEILGVSKQYVGQLIHMIHNKLKNLIDLDGMEF